MMGHSQMQVEPVIQELHIPAGLAGPVELTMDVRCFLVPHTGGLLLIDTGLKGSADAIAAALDRVGAAWSDITDVVLTHWHPDHVGGLGEVVERSPLAAIWAGAADVSGFLPRCRCARSWNVTGSAIFRSCRRLAIRQDTSACCMTTECCS